MARTGGKAEKEMLEKTGQGWQEQGKRKKEEGVVHKKKEELKEKEGKAKRGKLKEKHEKNHRKLKGGKERKGKKKKEIVCHGGRWRWKRRRRSGRK